MRKVKKGKYLSHPPINDEIGPIDEPALVAGQKHHRLRHLDRFPEAAGREMDFAPVPLGRVVAEPVLQEGRAGAAS